MRNVNIHKLRKEGWKIHIEHLRKVVGRDREDGIIPLFARHEIPTETRDPRGGITVVEIISPNGFSAEGQADCSLKENFNHKKANNIAIGRAMKKLAERP